jgi:hypothetical protein
VDAARGRLGVAGEAGIVGVDGGEAELDAHREAAAAELEPQRGHRRQVASAGGDDQRERDSGPRVEIDQRAGQERLEIGGGAGRRHRSARQRGEERGHQRARSCLHPRSAWRGRTRPSTRRGAAPPTRLLVGDAPQPRARGRTRTWIPSRGRSVTAGSRSSPRET